MDASVNLDRLATESRQPIELLFTNQLTNRQSLLRVVAPVAISDRRRPPNINGSLEDWSQADTIQDGPLVRMFNRPAVQKLELQYASTPTQIYSGWSPEELYLAFQVNGVQPSNGGVERSFVEYQLLVERKRRSQDSANPWEAVVGTAVRYAATLDAKPTNTTWRAELAIPWDAMNDPKHQSARPTLLRFNFSQHKNATGESASWAGPVDFGRDDSFSGVLYLRDPANPGIRVKD
jgi:hypothetical protein